MLDIIFIGEECEKLMKDRVCRGHVHSVFDRVINIETDSGHAVDSLYSVCTGSVPPAPSRVIVDTEASWLSMGLTPGREFRLACGDAPVWRCMEDYTLAAPEVILRRLSNISVPESEALRGIAYDDVDALIGRGLGLTPSGDDFIAGVLFGLRFLKCDRLLAPYAKSVNSVLHKTTRLSRHFLKYALAGKWGQTEQDVMFALMTDSGADLAKAVKGLLSVGFSSGADELQGMAAAIRAALEGKMA